MATWPDAQHYLFSRSRMLLPLIPLVIILCRMKELLKLTPGHDGAVWSYTSSGLARRRSHCHDELELNLVTAGTGRYDLTRGTLICLSPKQDHVLLDESRDYSMWIAVISPQLLSQACKNLSAK